MEKNINSKTITVKNDDAILIISKDFEMQLMIPEQPIDESLEYNSLILVAIMSKLKNDENFISDLSDYITSFVKNEILSKQDNNINNKDVFN